MFDGDVVLDRVNMAFRDEDNILDQIYEKQICFLWLNAHKTALYTNLN